MIAFGGAAAPPGAVFRSHTTRLVSLVRLALVAVALLFAPLAPALEVPELTGRVVDTAKVLSPDASARIERLLAAQEKETGQQFALLTVPTLDGQPIENFSIAVVDQWKLGQKGNDDGLLLLIVPKDKKVRIEVGRGLEGDVTDAISARVIRNVIGPAFRAGDYAGGVEKAFSALMRAASGKVPDIPDADTSPEVPNIPGSLLLFVLGIVLLPVVIGSIWGSRGSRGTTFYGGPAGYGGGGGGGGGFGGGDGGGFSGAGGGFGGGGASGSW